MSGLTVRGIRNFGQVWKPRVPELEQVRCRHCPQPSMPGVLGPAVAESAGSVPFCLLCSTKAQALYEAVQVDDDDQKLAELITSGVHIDTIGGQWGRGPGYPCVTYYSI